MVLLSPLLYQIWNSIEKEEQQ
uniref:Uncharacterized protein n=1 Tax=Arundo donax TaxID=35708 RepID=A0A0A9BIS5_ARUDO